MGTRRAMGVPRGSKGLRLDTQRHTQGSGSHQRANGGPQEAQEEKRRPLGGTERLFAGPSVAPKSPSLGTWKGKQRRLEEMRGGVPGKDENPKASPSAGQRKAQRFPVDLGLSLSEAVGGRKRQENIAGKCPDTAGPGVNRCRHEQGLGNNGFIVRVGGLPGGSLALEPHSSSAHRPQGSELPPSPTPRAARAPHGQA